MLEERSSKPQRFSKSCSRCRIRKLRCDRLLPCCTSCSKLKEGEQQCHYTSNPWLADIQAYEPGNAALRKEVSTLLCKVNSLEQQLVKKRQNDMQINVNHKSQEFDLSKFYNIYLKNLRFLYVGPTNYINTMVHDKYGMVMSKPYYKIQQNVYEQMNKNTRAEQEFFNSKKGSLFLEDFSRKYSDSEKPPQLPSSKELIIFLLEKFFDQVHFISPIIDKEDFFIKMSILFDQKSPYIDDVTRAILYIMLRFAYLTLSTEEKAKAFTHDITNAELYIPPSYIDYAYSLMMSSKSCGRIKLGNLQGLTLLYLYKLVCPEDDHDASDINLILHSAIDMAQIFGIPYIFENSVTDVLFSPEECKICRSIWIILVQQDSLNAFSFGYKPRIDVFSFENAILLLENEKLCTSSLSNKEIFLMKILDISIMRRVTLKLNDNSKSIALDDIEQMISDLLESLNKSKTFDEISSTLSSNSSQEEIELHISLLLSKLNQYYAYFVLNFLLSMGTRYEPESELLISRYLFSALEVGIILFELTIKFLQRRDYFGHKYIKILGSFLLGIFSKVLPGTVFIFCHILHDYCDMSEVVGCFRFSDSKNCMQNVETYTQNKTVFIKPYISKMEILYNISILEYVNYLSLYKIGTCLYFAFEYLNQAFPDIMSSECHASSWNIDSSEVEKFILQSASYGDNLTRYERYGFDYELFLSILSDK